MSLKVDLSKIEKRFDASQNDLVLQASDFSLQGLKEMVDNEVIDLTPKYQRRERWEIERQSQLIESFLLNVPVPPIYLAEEEYGIYSIIDGKQRVTAVSDFINNAYALKGLESFIELNGLKFRDLPRQLQSALKIRPYLRVITLLKQSQPQLKFEVFLRLNKGGIQLNNQEIRNVAFRGKVNEMVYRCAENSFLRKRLKIENNKSAAYKQMLDAELVLRFLSLSDIWHNFTGSLSRTLDSFMIENRDASNSEVAEFEDRFNEAISRVQTLWGAAAFQRWDGKSWRQQTLSGMYDAQMIAMTELSEKEFNKVSTYPREVLAATKKLFNVSEFEEAVRIGTNTPSRLRFRVEAIVSMLEQIA